MLFLQTHPPTPRPPACHSRLHSIFYVVVTGSRLRPNLGVAQLLLLVLCDTIIVGAQVVLLLLYCWTLFRRDTLQEDSPPAPTLCYAYCRRAQSAVGRLTAVEAVPARSAPCCRREPASSTGGFYDTLISILWYHTINIILLILLYHCCAVVCCL